MLQPWTKFLCVQELLRGCRMHFNRLVKERRGDCRAKGLTTWQGAGLVWVEPKVPKRIRRLATVQRIMVTGQVPVLCTYRIVQACVQELACIRLALCIRL